MYMFHRNMVNSIWFEGQAEGKSFPNLVLSTRNQIVFSVFWLIWNTNEHGDDQLKVLEHHSTMVSSRFKGGPRLNPIILHTDKSSRNLVESTRNQIAFTIFRLILDPNGRVLLDPSQSEYGKCNLISGWFNKIQKIFLYLQTAGKLFWFLLDPPQFDCTYSFLIDLKHTIRC